MSKNKLNGSTLCYSNVTISKYKNNAMIEEYKYHNTVTLNLFRGIGAFLQNLVESKTSYSDYIPKYVGLGIGKDAITVNSTKLKNEITTSRISLTRNSVYEQNGVWVIPYVATINYSSVGSNKISELGLFGVRTKTDTEDQKLLAGLILPEGSEIVLKSGYTYILRWEINLQAYDPNLSGGNN